MRTPRGSVAAAAAAVGLLLTALPAYGWDNASGLRIGDVVCTDQTRSDTGVRFHGHVGHGQATVSVRTAATAGGAETVAWSQTGVAGGFNSYVHGAPGTYYRGCVTVTANSAHTWARSALEGMGSSAGDIGAHTATLAPGGRACGDADLGPVRLTGTATAAVSWEIDASDQDYGFVGKVFGTGGASVDTVFVPGPELSLLELCVHNTSQQTVVASYELEPAQ